MTGTAILIQQSSPNLLELSGRVWLLDCPFHSSVLIRISSDPGITSDDTFELMIGRFHAVVGSVKQVALHVLQPIDPFSSNRIPVGLKVLSPSPRCRRL